jgi:hypothetical protein
MLLRLVKARNRGGHRALQTITAAGFTITKLDRDTMRKAPPVLRPLVVGIAHTNCQRA